jgi:ParB-like chromosome segregation protein Spo0J
MSADVFEQFKADIATHGQRETVKLWQGEVIDGRHRLRACEALGKQVRTEAVTLTEEGLPAYVLSLNAMRNHLSPSQRTMYAASVANMVRGHVKTQRKWSPNLVTIESAAKAMGVSKTSVIEAKRVLRDAAPELAEAVRKGALTVSAARHIMDAVPERSEQSLALGKVLTANPGTRRMQVQSVLRNGSATGAFPRRNRLPQKDATHQLDTIVEALSVSVENLLVVVARLNGSRNAQWVVSLRESRTAISTAIKSLEVA